MDGTRYTITDLDARTFLRESPRLKQIRATARIVASSVLIIIAVLATSTALIPKKTVESAPSIASAGTVLATAAPVLPASTELKTAPATTPEPTPVTLTLPDNTVSVSDLSIAAPVTWNVPLTDSAMNKALLNGPVHIAGTPLPGQKGMTTLAGHSSNYPWIRSDFNSVFAPLTHVKTGQTIRITYRGSEFTYTVSKIYEVSPSDTSILNDNRITGIRLITCTPVGTSLRRLIVEATQTLPNPTTNTQFTGTTVSGSLPSDN